MSLNFDKTLDLSNHGWKHSLEERKKKMFYKESPLCREKWHRMETYNYTKNKKNIGNGDQVASIKYFIFI